MPKPSSPARWSGFAALCRSLARLIRSVNEWVDRHGSLLGAWASLWTIVAVPTAFVGGWVAYSELRSGFLKPDIAFILETPKAPQFKLVNIGDAVLREPKYQLALFDLAGC